jgi:hypothetical protein
MCIRGRRVGHVLTFHGLCIKDGGDLRVGQGYDSHKDTGIDEHKEAIEEDTHIPHLQALTNIM